MKPALPGPPSGRSWPPSLAAERAAVAPPRGPLRQVLPYVGLGLLASSLVMVRVAWRILQGPEARPREAVARSLLPADIPPIGQADIDRLQSRALRLPVEGMTAAELRDNFNEARGGYVHEALDMVAPRGTRVLAVDDGRVEKLFDSVRGGLSVYHFDPTEAFCYYYAHLDGYAPGLREGDLVRKGSLLGYVGTTGNAPRDTPHLHFTVFKLGPDMRWWEGRPINPFPLWVSPDPR